MSTSSLKLWTLLPEFVWLLGLVCVGADLVIDVDITGCPDVPITQGVSQTFKLPSLYALAQVDIWIKPERHYTTSYNVEIRDNMTLLAMGSSSTLTLASSAEGTEATWYAFHFGASDLDCQLVLKPDHTYNFILRRLSPYSGAFSYCTDVYSDGSLSLSTSDPFPLNDMSFHLYATPLQLAHWTFNGDFDDVSPSKRPPAVPEGFYVGLLGDYVNIREHGYLNLPRVEIHNKSFTVAFNLRLPTSRTTVGPRYLYADWSQGQWQFISLIDDDNKMKVELRRNMETDGSNVEQGLVTVISSIAVPVGEWFDVAWTFDRPGRTLELYFSQQSVGTAIVRSSVTDMTLKISHTMDYKFGRKNEDSKTRNYNLDADLRHFRVYATSDITFTTL